MRTPETVPMPRMSGAMTMAARPKMKASESASWTALDARAPAVPSPMKLILSPARRASPFMVRRLARVPAAEKRKT